jgi:hypothetical protein
MENLTVTLKISRHFRGALLLHNSSMEAHLLFGDSYCECRITYDAIWGVTSEHGETTSWLEGFNDESLIQSGSETLQSTSVLSTTSPHRDSSSTPGTATPLQAVDSAVTLFDPTIQVDAGQVDAGQVDAGQVDAGLHIPESSNQPLHDRPGVLIARSSSSDTDEDLNSSGSENSGDPSTLGTRGESNLENKTNDKKGAFLHEQNKTPSFPPRLQSVLKTPFEQTLTSQAGTGPSAGEKVSVDKSQQTSSKKIPRSPGPLSKRSDSTNRPKLVRVK